MHKEVSLFDEVCLLQAPLVDPWRLMRFHILTPLGIVDAKVTKHLFEFRIMFQEQERVAMKLIGKPLSILSFRIVLRHTCGSSYPVNITVYFIRFRDADNFSADSEIEMLDP